MNRLAIQFLDQGLHRVVFDAMPIPVMVVDEDVGLLEYNAAAAQLVETGSRAARGRRAGDFFGCIHATETPEGCGGAVACANCVVRQSVKAAYHGQPVTRRRTWMEILSGKRLRKVDVRVSCQPFSYENNPFALLIVEGMND